MRNKFKKLWQREETIFISHKLLFWSLHCLGLVSIVGDYTVDSFLIHSNQKKKNWLYHYKVILLIRPQVREEQISVIKIN